MATIIAFRRHQRVSVVLDFGTWTVARHDASGKFKGRSQHPSLLDASAHADHLVATEGFVRLEEEPRG